MPKIISAFVLLFSTAIYAAPSVQLKTTWEAMENLAQNREPLTIKTQGDKTTYLKNDNLVINITIDKPGYLNVVSINKENKVVVLFPNKYHKDNKVEAGDFTLPTAKMKFDLATDAPYGKSLVMAFFTTHKINLYQPYTKSMDAGNDLKEQIFRELSNDEADNLQKDFSVRGNKYKNKSQVGKLELQTCETAGDC